MRKFSKESSSSKPRTIWIVKKKTTTSKQIIWLMLVGCFRVDVFSICFFKNAGSQLCFCFLYGNRSITVPKLSAFPMFYALLRSSSLCIWTLYAIYALYPHSSPRSMNSHPLGALTRSLRALCAVWNPTLPLYTLARHNCFYWDSLFLSLVS